MADEDDSSLQEHRWKRYDTQALEPRINTYHRSQVLNNIRKTLLDIGGQPLFDKFVEGCFGHLMAWRENSLNGKALHSLISHEIYMDGNPDEVWFNIGGENVRFCYIDYAVMTGLTFGASNFDPCAGHNPVVSGVYSRFCLCQPIQLKDLLDRFTRKVVDENYHDDYLKIANILMLYTFLLGSEGSKKIEGWDWVLVDDLDNWNAFPWGAYTYGALTHYISKLSKIKRSMRDRYHFYGPAWVFVR